MLPIGRRAMGVVSPLRKKTTHLIYKKYHNALQSADSAALWYFVMCVLGLLIVCSFLLFVGFDKMKGIDVDGTKIE